MITKNLTITVENIKLAGQLFVPDVKGEPHPLVIVCHGIPAGKAPDKNDGGYPLLAERICLNKMAVVIFNFRGTGLSGGNIDLLGWTNDLTAVIDEVDSFQEVDQSRIGLLGFSGGAATSVCVAARDPRVSCVAACACPADFSRMLGDAEPRAYVDHFRKIGLIRDKGFPPSKREWLDNFRKVSPVQCIRKIAPRPLLIVHGDGDEVVDISHAYGLFDKAGDPKEMVVLNGAGHGLRRDEKAVSTLINWFKSRLHVPGI